MAIKKNKVGQTLKREAIRFALERSQGMGMDQKFMSANKKKEPVYDDIEEKLNIPYVNREEVPLAMDVFVPRVPKDEELPVIVTIHGGGLTMGDRKLSRPFGRYLAHKGYLVFSVEYRLAPRANVCEELSDVCAGMDLVGKMLVDYNVDFTRIFLAAESAGAYLATYVSAMRGSDKLQKAIGYRPSRLSFKAIGLMSGMLYTNGNDPAGWMMADQIYGEKRADENFLQYMNPEHPEIINNLPPAYLITSRGDFLNNYSLKMHKALKDAGKIDHLQYYGDDNLSHAFSTMQLDNPKARESVDRMVEWFEKQAKLDIERNEPDPEIEKKRRAVEEKYADDSIDRQKIWQFVKEFASVYPDRLQKVAIADTARDITYEELFNEWDRYARVFSALDITSSNSSRAAVCGVIAPEPLFAFYGLNMVGTPVSMLSYPDFLPEGKWKTIIEKEHITDLIISDTLITPQVFREIQKEKENLGLRNVILMHSRVGGVCTGPAELIYNKFNSQALKRMNAVFMDDLIKEYESTPIRYSRTKGDHPALIAHTSGTSKGTRKPLTFTDRALNNASRPDGVKIPNLVIPGYRGKQLRFAIPFDFSALMSMGTANYIFASGQTLVTTFFGFIHPRFVKALDYYDVNVAIVPGFVMDKWLERTDLDDLSLMSMKSFGLGGSFVPPDKLEKYQAFLKDHGYENPIVCGYGMSEVGSTQIFKSSDSDDDTLGRPADKDKHLFRIQDENDNDFYTLDDGPRTGIMYITSPSMTDGHIDGEEFVKYTEIEGKKYICTNDVVILREDGNLVYAGRADRYFVNNDGVRFDAGQVEIQMSKQAGIKMCAVVPVLDKRIHDTVPALYVVPEGGINEAENVKTIENALREVFVKGGLFASTNLPAQFIIVDSVPCNANGKIDVHRITRERPTGLAYSISPVMDGEAIGDITVEKSREYNGITAGGLPEGMGQSSAFNVFDVFNADAGGYRPVPLSDFRAVLKAFCPVTITVDDSLKKAVADKFDMSDLSNPVIKKAQKLMGKFYKMQDMDYDFGEDSNY